MYYFGTRADKNEIVIVLFQQRKGPLRFMHQYISACFADLMVNSHDRPEQLILP
jgi:hypothetical protein